MTNSEDITDEVNLAYLLDIIENKASRLEDKNAKLKNENDRLREENEMLRNRVAGKYRAMLDSPNPVLRLMAEDELRELGIEVIEDA